MPTAELISAIFWWRLYINALLGMLSYSEMSTKRDRTTTWYNLFMLRTRFQLAFLFFLPSICLASPQTEVLAIKLNQPYTTLNGYLEILEDPEGEYSFETLSLSGWKKQQGRFEQGLSSSVWWLRFILLNNQKSPITVNLEVGFPQLDSIQVYQPYSNHPIRMGDDHPYKTRPIAIRTLATPLQVMPGQHRYYLRVKTTSSFIVPLAIVSRQNHLERVAKEQVLLGAFYGMAFAFILYNFVLFFGTRENAYALFAICCSGMAGIAACFDGTGFSIWGNHLYWQDRAIFFFVSTTLSSLFQFARIFLDLAHTDPRTERTLGVLSYGWAGLAITSLILSVPFSMRIVAPLVLISFFLIGIIAVIKLKGGNINAVYFLLAISMLVLMGTPTSLASIGLLEGFYLLSLVGMKISFTGVMIFLTIGQVHRFTQLKKLRHQASLRLAHARAESEAKSSFLAKMSHELRTPMNAVLGMVELMRDTTLDEQQRDNVDLIENAGRSLLSVIDDVMDFSRLQTDKLTLNPEPFDLYQTLSDCHQLIKRSFQKEGVDIQFQWHPQTPRYLAGDSSRIRQVVLNLLGNACKFTEKGQVTLRTSAGKRVMDFHEVVIEVEDSGIGISVEAINKLFKPFVQADSSTSRDYGGTGLGLSISKQIVELMGGEIQVTSELGEGSCFWFSFQARHAELSPQRKHQTKYEQLPNIHLLVAEDNKVNRQVVRGFLGRLGIEPVFAINGRELVEIYRKSSLQWDLIFMDCEMPEMDGFHATEAIRSIEEELDLRTVPIVGLSAHVLPEYHEKGLACGMQDYLNKPLVFNELMEAVKKFTHAKCRNTPQP